MNVVKETEKSIWYSSNLDITNVKSCLLSRKESIFAPILYENINDLKKDVSLILEKRIRDRENEIARYKSNLDRLITMEATEV